MKTTIADKIMVRCWGQFWDENSPAHKYWKRQIKKRKRSKEWWMKNWKRIYDK